MSGKTTILDVARYVNVSVTTVSLALSGKGRISENTRKKIDQAMHDLGYIRNKNAASLRNGHSAIVGVIIKDLQNPFYANVISGINKALAEKGYIIFLIHLGTTNLSLLESVNSLIEFGVSGIIFLGNDLISHNIKLLADKHNIPLIISAQSSSENDISLVRADNHLGAKMATEYLINKGHRQIAYLGGKMGSLTRADRLEGFADALSKHGLKLKPEWVISEEQPELFYNYELFLKQNPTVSAFLCHDSPTTLALLVSASKLGRNISKSRISSYLEAQVEIVSFGIQNDIYISKDQITYIDSRPIEMGYQAANALLENKNQYKTIIIQPELIV